MKVKLTVVRIIPSRLFVFKVQFVADDPPVSGMFGIVLLVFSEEDSSPSPVTPTAAVALRTWYLPGLETINLTTNAELGGTNSGPAKESAGSTYVYPPLGCEPEWCKLQLPLLGVAADDAATIRTTEIERIRAK